jgi:iron complex outermembrane receptor protein
MTSTFMLKRLPLAAWMLCSPIAFSQESAQTEGTLQEVMVTAERRSTNLQETPLAISAFGGDDLKIRSINDPSDLQYLVPGLTVGTKGQIARITMRGIGMENVLGGSIGGDPGVSYNVNGVVYARPQMARPGFFDVERVEVLRGPQGTLYGRNATGGSINIITRQPTATHTANADLTVGSRGLMQFEGGIGGPLKGDDILGRIAIRTSDEDGDLKNVQTGGRVGSISERSVRGSVLLNPDGALKLLLDADYYQNHGTAPSFIMANNVTGGTTPGEALGGRLLTDQRHVDYNTDGYNVANIWGTSAKLTWDLGGPSLSSLTSFRRMYVNEGQDLDGSGGRFANTNFRYNHSHQLSEELQLSSNPDSKLQWVLGGFYFDEDSDAAQQFEFYTFKALFNSGGTVKSTSYAGYGQATYPVLERVNLTLGGRYTVDRKEMTEFFSFGANGGVADNSETWNAFTPRVSVDWKISDAAMVYATFAKGFKSGGFNVGALQANAYDPETVRSYEAGAKLRLLENSVQLNAAAFHYDYANLQVNQLVGLVAALRNAAQSDIDGVEVELAARVADVANFNVTYAYLDATFNNFFNTENAFPALGLQNLAGNPLPRSPKHSLNVGAEYTASVGTGTLTTRADWSYKSQMYFSEFRRDSVGQPSYSLLDMSLTYAPGDERYYASVFGTNLTDEKVWTNVSVNTAVLGFTRATDINTPRTFGVRGGYRF